MREVRTPILIVGGGVGGVAAALAVAEAGQRCVLAHSDRVVGGQLTVQAVPPDENPWIEGRNDVQGAPARYLDFRRRVRAWVRRNQSLTEAAAADERLNPGGGWVSHLCHDPRVGLTTLQQMLMPHVEAGRITYQAGELAAVECDGDRVIAVTFTSLDESFVVIADVVLDATELGDLYPLAGLPHRVGSERRDRFGELHGHPDRDDPNDQQAITWCFAVEHHAGEDHTVQVPSGDYARWRDWMPPVKDDAGDEPLWSWPLFSWRVPGHRPGEVMELPLVPPPDEPPAGQLELWRYRRIIDAAVFRPGGGATDVSVMNTVQMDYFRRPVLRGIGEPTDGNVFEASTTDREAFERAKLQSLCFLRWMQTEAPRHDTADRRGYPGLKPWGDFLFGKQGFAGAPYIREPRRPVTLETLTEAHVGAEQRLAAGHKALDAPSAVLNTPTPGAHVFADSVGIGHYRLDLHPSAAMRGGLYAPCCPFQIPLGALLLPDAANVVAAGKALGVTHITNAATRLHPVEWAVGEAAGVLAALAVTEGVAPRDFHGDAARVGALRAALRVGGAPLAWPWDAG